MRRQSLPIAIALICIFFAGSAAFGQAKGKTSQMQVTVHVVKSGDLAIWIAKDYGIELAKLKQLNPGRDLAHLNTGDRLVVGEKPIEFTASQVASKDAEVTKSKDRPDKIAMMLDDEKGSKPKEKSPNVVVSAISMIFKLAIVLGLAYLTIYVLKMFSDKRQSLPQVRREMKVVDTVRLSNASCLHLVELGGKTLLIGSSSGQVNLLTEVEQTDAAENELLPEGRFAEHLARYSGEKAQNTPAGRVAGLLRDCAGYLKERRRGSEKIGGSKNAGDRKDA